MSRHYRPRHLIASSHRSCLAAFRSLRASPLLLHVIGICSGADTIPLLLAARPASSTRRAGRYDSIASVLGSACLPLGSPSHPCVRHRMATGNGACLVRLSSACQYLWLVIGAATRPLAQSDFLAVHHLIALPPRSLDTGDGAGAPWSRLLAFAVRFRLRSICACSVYCGGEGCLVCLAVVLCMLSMG